MFSDLCRCTGEYIFEIGAQIFLTSLRQCRFCDPMTILPKADQNEILNRTWHQSFVLMAAFWPTNLITLLSGYEIDFSLRVLQNVARKRITYTVICCFSQSLLPSSILSNRPGSRIENIVATLIASHRAMRLDPVEYNLVLTLVLCRPGKSSYAAYYYMLHV